MPGLDGIGVARALAAQNPSPAVVFVTAFDQFAVAAFEVEAVDYLMKPVDPIRLQRALDRARAYLQQRSGAAGAGQGLAMARGILGVGPVGPGADRRAGRRPGVGRARLHAAPRRPPQLADPPFDGGARGRPRSRAVRPASSLGDRAQGFHHRASPATRRAAGSRGSPTAPSSRSAGSIRTASGRSPDAKQNEPPRAWGVSARRPDCTPGSPCGDDQALRVENLDARMTGLTGWPLR